MAYRGMLFAISNATNDALLNATNDHDVLEIIQSLEEDWIEENLCELDKSWDAMHRALSDGSLDFKGGEPPLRLAILGGRHLHEGDNHVVALVSATDVKAIAVALAKIDDDAFRALYEGVVPHDYAPEYGDEDRDYTCAYFAEVRAFYEGAARAGRAVVFSVDQ